MTTQASAESFAVWLLITHPALFYAVAKQMNPGLGAFSDIVSNIGGAFSTAVSAVGKFMANPQNIQSLTGLASTYFATQATKKAADAQLAILKTQADRAQVGEPAAPISYAYDSTGNPVPVYTGYKSAGWPQTPQVSLPSGQVGYQVSPDLLQNLSPGFFSKYGLWLGAGAAVLVVAIIAFRRS